MGKLKLLKYKIKIDRINLKIDIEELYIDIFKEDKTKYIVKLLDEKEDDIFSEDNDCSSFKEYYKEDEGQLKRLLGKRNYEYFEVIEKKNVLKEEQIIDKIKELIKKDILEDISKLEVEMDLLNTMKSEDIF